VLHAMHAMHVMYVCMYVCMCHLKRSGERKASVDMGALTLALGAGLEGAELLTVAPSE
jgi:hypothetical protein